MDKRKERGYIHMAEVLGRVERLLGNNIQSNPYDVASNLGMAFIKGWMTIVSAKAIDPDISKQLINTAYNVFIVLSSR
jgi:hypothetical protein